jgi:predicted Zn-dependent protease
VDQLIARSRAAIEAEHYHPAIATLAGVFSQHPRRSDAALLLARAYHLASQHESALAVLEQALLDGSGDGELLSLHVRVLLSLGQFKAAEETLEELKAAEPTSPWLSPLAGFIALASSRTLDGLERTRSVVDDPEAEALRSATRALLLWSSRTSSTGIWPRWGVPCAPTWFSPATARTWRCALPSSRPSRACRPA